MNVRFVPEEAQRIGQDSEYVNCTGEIVLGDCLPLAGRTVVVEFGIGLMGMAEIRPDAGDKIVCD